MRSSRAHFQQCTTVAGKYRQSRRGVVRLTLHDEFYRRPIFTEQWSDVHYGSLEMMNLIKAIANCIFGVKCLSPHSNQQISKMLLQIAPKGCVQQLTSNWWRLLDERVWIARWWCVIKFTQFKWLLSAWVHCALEWCVLRITPARKKLLCGFIFS